MGFKWVDLWVAKFEKYKWHSGHWRFFRGFQSLDGSGSFGLPGVLDASSLAAIRDRSEVGSETEDESAET